MPFVAAELVAPRADHLEIAVALGKPELGVLERFFQALEPLDELGATRHREADVTAPALRLRLRQVELLLGIAELGSERFDAAERSFKVAQADAKTRSAAESYLKHLEQKRARLAIADPNAVAGEDPGLPVSDAGAASTDSRL